MAAKKRKKTKKYAAVVGLAGSGKVAIKSAKANLSDFIEAQDGEILWVLPHTADNSKPLAKVKDFLWDEDAKYALVSDGTDEDEDWEENAQTVVEVEEDTDTYAALVTEIAGYEADELILMIILDEEADADLDLLDVAVAEGITCLDLASGITEIELAEVEEPEEAAAEEDDDTSDDASDSDDDAPAVRDEPPFSAKVQKLIDKGNFARAGEAMAEELGADGVKDLAEEFGLEFKKGAWSKTIGAGIAEHLAGGAADSDEDVVEAEVVEEEEPKPKAKKSKAAKSAPSEETDTDEVAEAGEARISITEAEYFAKQRLLELLAGVASAQGVSEMKSFYTFIKGKGLAD